MSGTNDLVGTYVYLRVLQLLYVPGQGAAVKRNCRFQTLRYCAAVTNETGYTRRFRNAAIACFNCAPVSKTPNTDEPLPVISAGFPPKRVSFDLMRFNCGYRRNTEASKS